MRPLTALSLLLLVLLSSLACRSPERSTPKDVPSEVLTDSSAWHRAYEASRPHADFEVVDVGTAAAVLAQVCSNRNAVGIVALPRDASPSCQNHKASLEKLPAGALRLVLAVHQSSTWLTQFPSSSWEHVATISEGRTPLFSDLHPSFPNRPMMLYAPTSQDARYALFEHALSAPVARRLQTHPLDADLDAYCDAPEAVAWLAPSEAARCSMRSVEPSDAPTQWQLDLYLVRQTDVEPNAQRERVWSTLAAALPNERLSALR